MDDLLQAQGGEIAVTYQVDALGRVIAGGERLVEDTLGESQAGVVLTLDGELQKLAEEASADLGQGAVVITQVPDCEILALASVPDFHPDRVGEAVDREDSPLVNRAFSAYAPGSVFKLVVAAALLEQGRPVESFPCTGSVNVNGLTFSCAGGQAHGEVDLEQALAQSCNGYFINAARSLGGQAILTMAYNLGLGEEVEFGRGLRSGAGRLPSLSSLENPRALGNFAFGQGELTATPLQLCALVNAVASEGVYATPKLLLGEVEADGRTKELSPCLGPGGAGHELRHRQDFAAGHGGRRPRGHRQRRGPGQLCGGDQDRHRPDRRLPGGEGADAPLVLRLCGGQNRPRLLRDAALDCPGGGGGGRGRHRPGVPDPGPGPGGEALLAILPCFFQGSGGFSSPSGG